MTTREAFTGQVWKEGEQHDGTRDRRLPRRGACRWRSCRWRWSRVPPSSAASPRPVAHNDGINNTGCNFYLGVVGKDTTTGLERVDHSVLATVTSLHSFSTQHPITLCAPSAARGNHLDTVQLDSPLRGLRDGRPRNVPEVAARIGTTWRRTPKGRRVTWCCILIHIQIQIQTCMQHQFICCASSAASVPMVSSPCWSCGM
jgi:hypothetical protein